MLFPLIALTALAQPAKYDPAKWEKSIAAFEQKDREKAPPENAVLFVGSSSIVRWKLDKSFPALDAINRGFGGSQIVDSVHFAPRIVTKYRPRTVVFYAGDNDIGSGKSPEQVASDFGDFVKAVRKDLPKAKIVFVSIKPSIRRWALWEKISRANKLIAGQCAKDERLTFLDVGLPMLGADGMPKADLFVADGLHLSEKGYALWTELLKPHLAVK